MKTNKTILSTLCVLLCAGVLLGGCGAAPPGSSGSSGTLGGASVSDVSASAKVSAEDLDAGWDEASATVIQLEGDGIAASGAGVTISGSTATITAAGTYVLRGTLADGQIVIDAPDTALVRLVLDGAAVHCTTSAAIHCQQADKLVVILANGSSNTLSDGETYIFPDESTDEPSATLFSKADLTINGGGSLSVAAACNNGIGTKDDLILVSGSIEVTAANHTIRGRDSVTVLETELVLNAGSDGIQANNDTAEDKGWIELYGGSCTITAAHDGIQAETTLAVYGGNYTITSGGGAANAPARQEETFGPGGFAPDGQAPPPQNGTMPEGEGGTFSPPTGEDFAGGTPPTPPDGTEGQAPPDAAGDEGAAAGALPPADGTDTASGSGGADDTAEASGDATEDSSDSYKGLKAGTQLSISGGTFRIDAADDALHTNGNATISGGALTIQTGDDGLHGDADVLIQGDADIDIQQSYEGIEGAKVTIQGGNICVVASDDGINAAGGRDAQTAGAFQRDSFAAGDYSINIEGGTVVLHAGTDALDSNGNITITGGTTVVHMSSGAGGSMGGDGILDKDGNLTITGGTLVGAGANGVVSMGGTITSNNATQPTLEIYYSAAQAAGTLVTLSDADGSTLCSFAPQYEYSCIVVTSPNLADGASYTVSSGGEAAGDAIAGLYTGAISGGTQLTSVTLSGALTSITDTGEAANTGGRGNPGGMPPQ